MISLVDSARGTLKSPRAVALNDGMLAASAKLYPGQHVRLLLRFESVRRREGSHWSAIKAADGCRLRSGCRRCGKPWLGCR